MKDVSIRQSFISGLWWLFVLSSSHPPPRFAQGELDVRYNITVAGRDGKLYHIRNGELTQTIIQLEAQPVGLVGRDSGRGRWEEKTE